MKKTLSIIVLSLFFVWATSAAYENNIVDVTNGEELRGIVTSSDAAWFAKAGYYDDEYTLHAEFSWLTDPQGDDFYEGWVVRQSPFAFISTGELEKKDGKYVNHYTSSVDYTDYDFYVLTLEPNDWNDAPADHILEWNVVMAKMMDDAMMKHDDNMMDKMEDTMMKKDEMMMKKLTAKQEVLKKGIKKRLANIDASKLDIEKISERLQNVRDSLDGRWFSEAKKARYIEILDVIEVAVYEISQMSQ